MVAGNQNEVSASFPEVLGEPQPSSAASVPVESLPITESHNHIRVEVINEHGLDHVFTFSENEEVIIPASAFSGEDIRDAGESVESQVEEVSNGAIQTCTIQSPEESVAIQSQSTSFADLMPLPHCSKTNVPTKRKRKVGHSDILTSTPYKQQLESQKTTIKKVKVTAKKRLKFDGNKTAIGAVASKGKKGKGSEQENRHKCGKKTGKKQDKDDDASCLYCGEWFSETGGNWIQCEGECHQWAHALCAGKSPSDQHYVCENCE